tara:strand:- start:8072 stop:8410 length:339 start_codon:yes stop_codon:yes gene_type:complete
MNPIIIQNSKIPQYLSWFIDVGAITLFPFIISREKMSDVTLNHEKIHIKQQAELLIVGFYALYISYWCIALAKGLRGDEAYHAIPFEIEAYAEQDNEHYLTERKRFAWTAYL